MKKTEVFSTYWQFASKRQSAYWSRLRGNPQPWTDDQILRQFRFTNVYRASDRVSQYLLARVQYDSSRSQTAEEVLFRTLLFKLFNKIDTWELLENSIGRVTYENFDYEVYNGILTEAKLSGKTIYSGAYIMPSAGQFGSQLKHQNHLRLLEHIMRDGVAAKVARVRSLKELYELLLSYPTLGPFLAFQFAIDINYTQLVDFDEDDFVVAGPGAISGIRKCFSDLGQRSNADIIRYMTDRQSLEFALAECHFETIGSRPLKLIDCQNIFCEVDKYARVRHPEISLATGRTRIKQLYRPNFDALASWFPPKWGINNQLERSISLSNLEKHQ